MKLRILLSALFILVSSTQTIAENKQPLTQAEFLSLLAFHWQVPQKMEYERKKFTTNVRPYEEQENIDYSCNTILVFKENLKFINKYPEYKNTVQVQNIVSIYETGISGMEKLLKEGNLKCKGYAVRMPTSTEGSMPVVMTDNEANQKYIDYYSRREQIINAYSNATDPDSKRKQICKLKTLSNTTEIYIYAYRSMVQSPEGQKVLATIKNDQDYMRTKLSMDEKCGL